MNILYISNKEGKLSSGPSYSIPCQIIFQKKYDNVFWYNLSSKKIKIYEKFDFYHDKTEYNGIADLPVPFNHPDLIIVEEVYVYHDPKILFEIQKINIPYVIIPRSQLTYQAQKRKALKKKIGNCLIYSSFIQNATAIQFLTKQEKEDSICQWKKKYFIIPNGIEIPDISPKKFHKDKIEAVYIGRLEPYQKGIDLLLSACDKIQSMLRQSRFSLSLYGSSDIKDKEKILALIDKYKISDIVKLHDGVYNEEKTSVLKSADIFVMTSRFEGQPMGLLEALSYGLPCLVTKGTNMADEIEKSNAGWTADTTTKSIISALNCIINDNNQLEKKSKNALNLAKNYNWDKIAQRSHKLYINLKRKMP